MLAPGSRCKYRISLAERSDCTETIINPLLADSYQNPISEGQVIIKLHLVAEFKSESDTYFSPPAACPPIVSFTTSTHASSPHCTLVPVPVSVSPQLP